MLDEDLDAFLEDHGVPCSCGGIEFKGIKEAPDEALPVGHIGAQSAMVTLLVKSSIVAVAGIKSGTQLVVDGVPFTARVPVRLEDGAFTSIPLTKGSA